MINFLFFDPGARRNHQAALWPDGFQAQVLKGEARRALLEYKEKYRPEFQTTSFSILIDTIMFYQKTN